MRYFCYHDENHRMKMTFSARNIFPVFILTQTIQQADLQLEGTLGDRLIYREYCILRIKHTEVQKQAI